MEIQAVNEIRMTNEWNDLIASLDTDSNPYSTINGKKPTKKAVAVELGKRALDIGRRFGCKAGKWLFMPYMDPEDDAGRERMDQAWNTIARLVCLEAPERLADTAKIATAEQGKPDTSRVICIYVDDFDNNDVVEELGNLLVEKLSTIYNRGRIYFKPDLYTHFGIYCKNPWGIPASLQTKKWPEEEEKIEEPEKEKEEPKPKKKRGKDPDEEAEKRKEPKKLSNPRSRRAQRSIFA
jgi:hypothetical protein